MPRGKRAGQKGQTKMGAVRDFLAGNPRAKTPDIVEALKEQGLEISPQQASTYRYHLRRTAKAKKRGAARREARAAAAANGSGEAPLVQKARELIELLGKDQAKRLIDSL